MRSIPPSISAKLKDGVATLAQLWRLKRQDGLTIFGTDHDSEIRIGDDIYHPGLSLSWTGHQEKAGAGNAEDLVEGVLTHQGVSEADLQLGLWDGAEIELDLVDWADLGEAVALVRGRLGGVKREGLRFRAEVLDLRHHLEAPVGRLYSRRCDAVLGDSRCKVNLEASAFRTSAPVLAVITPTRFRLGGLEAFAQGWFSGGVLRIAGGKAIDILTHTRQAQADVLQLCAPTALTTGQTVIVTVGCDKSATMCRAKFANIANFRGFPHMPGPDTIIGGVDPSAPLDGRRRQWR